MSDPEGRRAQLPEAYGLKEDSRVLPWSHVRERMTAAKHYWIATASAAGSAYCRPVDGIWLDDKLWFGGSPEARWRRNLEQRPDIEVHLEDAASPVILSGRVETFRNDRATAERLLAAALEKYPEYEPKLEHFEDQEELIFRPRMVLAWTLLYEDATRFDLPVEDGP
ncbi:MAG: pyridoxamine 5'-phosphate oxidase family protein [Thermoanaerobaculia bacterium]|nr:pyridoxamine 5'-phosphate oxidase family protein [Thermoanaerobaculia bacterium]